MAHLDQSDKALRHPTRRVGFARSTLLAAIALCACAAAAGAQTRVPDPDPDAGSVERVLSTRYGHSGLGRFFLGGGYRDLWSTPIRVPLLDVDATADGLTPVGTGGYGQTSTLEFLGADGRSYAVRSVDKDLTRRLDSLFVGTVVASIVRDQVGQFLPTGGLVVDPLLDAAGILHPTHRLVELPDHPRLGPYRSDFAGLVGMFVERPMEGPGGTPGFAGSTRVVSTAELIERLDAGGCARVDAREYLKARLIDMLVGDRDRHEGQWRWARFPVDDVCERWRPVPEDRDEAFVLNDGFMMTLVRLVRPQQVRFGPEYPSLVGLTYNGWELDRRFLAELDEAAWREVAEEVVAGVTDDVIDDAVSRLPDPHRERRGEFLSSALRSRRDALVEEALAFYRLLAGEPEIRASDLPERAILEHLPDGALRVSIAPGEGPGESPASGSAEDGVAFARTFRPDDTREVRVFLGGGDDAVEVRGAGGRITVRVIGGAGDDAFTNASRAPARRTRFYDAEGTNRFSGRASVDEHAYVRPTASNLVHRHALDWGWLNRYIPHLGYDPDLGVSGGLSVGFQRYGFRKSPWASDNVLRAAVASGGPGAYLSWSGHYRDVGWGADLTFDAEYSSLDVLRFHGFGNETALDAPSGFYEVDQRTLRVSPGLQWSWGHLDRGDSELDLRRLRPILALDVGPVLEHTYTPSGGNADRFIGALDPSPLGFGSFGQIGGRVDATLDTRDRTGYASSGARVAIGGSAFPAIWDVDDEFAEIHGVASAYLTPDRSRLAPTLALRAGGRAVFGAFPYHEAAYLGGSGDVRGLRSGRFAGDRAVFGNAELRLPLGRFRLLFPTEIGVHGAADVGRVFFDGDGQGSGSWHAAFGGGVWLALLDRTQALGITVMNGDDLTGLYVQAGLHF